MLLARWHIGKLARKPCWHASMLAPKQCWHASTLAHRPCWHAGMHGTQFSKLQQNSFRALSLSWLFFQLRTGNLWLRCYFWWQPCSQTSTQNMKIVCVWNIWIKLSYFYLSLRTRLASDCSNGAISVQSQEINVKGTSYKELLSEFFLTLNITGVLRFFYCSHAMEHEHRIPIESICSKRDRMMF